MISRRGLVLAGLTIPALARAADRPAVRVGVLPFGTVSWEAETIRRLRLDDAAGYRLETVKLATNDAARIAFQAGQVDTIVTDVLLAARLRNEGRDVRFLPYSSTEGGVMVPAASPIRRVEDLSGKRVGVAGGPLDKNWLLLRAHAQEKAGLDLATAAAPAYGAPPLLMSKLESGELDAALLFWNFCARLEARGFRRMIGAGDIAQAAGLKGEMSLLGYMFDQSFLDANRAAADGFAASSRAAKRALGEDASAFAAIRPLMDAPDDATFAALKRYFIEGIPRRAIAEESADAATLYAVLQRLGGEKLTGSSAPFPRDLYWDGAKVPA